MAINQNGEMACRNTTRSTMEDYDALHPTLRELSRNAALHIHDPTLASVVRHYGLEQVKEMIAELVTESCLLEYGPDHPQAK